MTLKPILKEALAGGQKARRRPVVRCPFTPGPWYAFDTPAGRVARQTTVLPDTWQRAGNPRGYPTAHLAMCA